MVSRKVLPRVALWTLVLFALLLVQVAYAGAPAPATMAFSGIIAYRNYIVIPYRLISDGPVGCTAAHPNQVTALNFNVFAGGVNVGSFTVNSPVCDVDQSIAFPLDPAQVFEGQLLTISVVADTPPGPLSPTFTTATARGIYTAPPQLIYPTFNDGRLPSRFFAAPVAVYTPRHPQTGQCAVEIWVPGSGRAIYVSPEELASYPAGRDQNAEIASYENRVFLYRLVTGALQVNAGPDASGNVYVMVFSEQCSPTVIYEGGYTVSTGQ